MKPASMIAAGAAMALEKGSSRLSASGIAAARTHMPTTGVVRHAGSDGRRGTAQRKASRVSGPHWTPGIGDAEFRRPVMQSAMARGVSAKRGAGAR